MNREQKAAAIAEIAAQIEGAQAILAVDYRGISVPQAAELRAGLGALLGGLAVALGGVREKMRSGEIPAGAPDAAAPAADEEPEAKAAEQAAEEEPEAGAAQDAATAEEPEAQAEAGSGEESPAA